MIRRCPIAASLLLASLVACAAGNASSGEATPPATPPAGPPANGPPLVVLVVVDQLRADLLDRYAPVFTGGFRRLRGEGRSYASASHAHSATETAVGHASLATGVHPRRHGVIANGWYEFVGGNWVVVPNISDPSVKIVGFPSGAGVSPVRLERPGFAEWLVAADPRSIVASVSGKDRGAVQPAAHVKSAFVYWFDPAAGRFVTSTYYRTSDPDWVTQFNATTLQAHRADTVWQFEAPPAALALAGRDTSVNEADGAHTFFPHRFAVEGTSGAFWPWWLGTPQQDVATLEMARAMVTSLNLGRDASPDFLNVSLSATDYIGHSYGPVSREQVDNLVRLDRHLGEFFAFLDQSVGKGKWTVMLTSDHGVSDMPEDRIARGEYGHRITADDRTRMAALREAALENPDRMAAARRLAQEVKRLPFVEESYTHQQLLTGQPRDSMELLHRRSFFPGRFSGPFSREGVEVRLKPGVLYSLRGTSHGTAWWYDRHVPMIFMGPGIAAGQDSSRAETVDFAPTFAAILGLKVPGDLDGKVLAGVVR